MKATKQIDIYLTKKRNVRLIDVVQYDTGIQLVFTVKDFTIPSGATATLYVQKPSGKFVFQENGITVADNTITIDLHNQAITEHGKVPYQVSIKNGSDVITTFTGLMMVEKSLADANATESKTVIRAFDEAVSDHVAEFQTKAEQIVQACIATIPEDYTVMEAKVNELANAVKGYLSGAVVFADDVSPVEHNPVVRVHGKNLFDTSKITPEPNTSNIYISSVGEGYIEITVDDTYDGNGHRATAVRLKELCPQMKPGKQYVLSATTGAWNKVIHLRALDMFWSFGSALTVTEEMLECTVGFYGFAPFRGQSPGTCRISNIHIEEGEVATDYEPYIDPSTVTVSRFGKNLVNVSSDAFTQYKRVVFDHPLPAGSYTMSARIETNDTDDNQMLVSFNLSNGSTLSRTFIADNNRKVNDFTVDLPITGINFYASSTYNGGEGDTARWIDFQLEVGDKATDYEPYNGTAYIPAADGTVSGVTSISPNMTILTDTEGVIVECEYNRDTNKVIDKLTKAITALGGTV